MHPLPNHRGIHLGPPKRRVVFHFHNCWNRGSRLEGSWLILDSHFSLRKAPVPQLVVPSFQGSRVVPIRKHRILAEFVLQTGQRSGGARIEGHNSEPLIFIPSSPLRDPPPGGLLIRLPLRNRRQCQKQCSCGCGSKLKS